VVSGIFLSSAQATRVGIGVFLRSGCERIVL
jgi:hypothetical protein